MSHPPDTHDVPKRERSPSQVRGSRDGFACRIRPAVNAELEAAHARDGAGDARASFRHLERAHVLGQASTVQHVRVHTQMLLWAIRHRVAREAWGQIVRIIGAATKTALGWVPTGNTGGADVSPFKPMPVPPDLQRLLLEARSPAGLERR